MTRIVTIIITAGIIVAIVAGIFSVLPTKQISMSSMTLTATTTSTSTLATTTLATTTLATTTPVFVVTHIAPPKTIRGIYFTNWAAGTPSFRKSLYNLLNGTILNAVVIDVKDYSGRIGFKVDDTDLMKIGASQDRIPDIKEFIVSLHVKGIYVIGRVATFQDPFIVKVKPEWAVHDSRTGALWHDSGGAYWADPTNKEVWQYNVAIAKAAYAVGFDEINFDYVRFPSDGSVSTTQYSALPSGKYIYTPIHQATTTPVNTSTTTKISSPTSTKKKTMATSTKVVATSTRIYISGKERVIKDFFSYLNTEFVEGSTSIPISGDLFGQVTSDPGDMGIGQKLENAMPYFDYIDPMVYPSHYINGFIGYTKPATHPYEIVKYAMDFAVRRSKAASSSPLLMRPWLQAFDLGAIYTPDMVRAQIRATYDAGLTSWILWNAGSVYDKSALLTDPKPTELETKDIIKTPAVSSVVSTTTTP